VRMKKEEKDREKKVGGAEKAREEKGIWGG